MPLQKLQFRPGVNREGTNYSNEGGWYECDKIRFRSGYPEKLGGWQSLSNPNLYTFKGVARSLWNWVTLNYSNLMAIGTSCKVYVENGGNYNDITPQISPTTTLGNNPFATTSGSKLVTVTATGHGTTAGTYVSFSGATAVGGLTISGAYEIIETPDGNSYTIIAASAASSTATGGGSSVVATYDIPAGLATYTTGNGWGAGAWASYSTVSLTNPFSATATGISVLTVTHSTAHNLTTGDYVYFASIATLPCSVTINGLTPSPSVFQKAFQVTVTGANTYTISIVIGSDTYITNSTSASGGAVTVYLPAPPVRGWGSATTVGVGQQLRLWSFDNFGQDLVMAIRGGKIYYWAADTSSYARAITLSSAATTAGYSGTFVPHTTLQIFASDTQRFGIAFGSNPYDPTDANTTFDPMLVRWSDQENIYDWVPTTTNQAGELKLSNGSTIVAGVHSRQENLIYTDTALFVMQYLGPPYVWGFNLIADNISIMSPGAVTSVNNVTYWMGVDKFYTYTGRVETLPCTLRQYVFNNFNYEQAYQVVSGSNEGYNEVWWFYPSANSPVNDSYVIFNHLERIWYYGTINRTAWLDSALRQKPMGAFSIKTSYLDTSITATATNITLVDATSYPYAGTIQIGSEIITYTGSGSNTLTGCTRGVAGTTAASHSQYDTVFYLVPNQVMYHEVGVNDGSLPTALPIEAYVGSSDFDIGDGHNFGFVWRIIPDVNFAQSAVGSQLTMTVRPRQNSGSAYGTPDPTTVQASSYTVDQYTGQVYTRLRGRQMSFKIDSTDLDVTWQLGTPRIDIRPDGRR